MSVREWFQTHCRDEDSQSHIERFVQSWLRIQKLLSPESRVIDLGGQSIFTDFLQDHNVDVCTFNFDLRYDFPLNDGVFDLALCMETVEHVKDRAHKTLQERADFTGSGIKNVFAEVYRILRNDGALFLTTPNVCA